MQERHAALELAQPSWMRETQVAYVTALSTERDMKKKFYKPLPRPI